MSMVRLCYAAPTTIIADWLKCIEAAGYRIQGDITGCFVRAYWGDDEIFNAVEIKRGFWAARGDDKIITPLDNEKEV